MNFCFAARVSLDELLLYLKFVISQRNKPVFASGSIALLVLAVGLVLNRMSVIGALAAAGGLQQPPRRVG